MFRPTSTPSLAAFGRRNFRKSRRAQESPAASTKKNKRS
jgi:hypothetical protein